MIIDLHSHTKPKSEDSDLTPGELIGKAKLSGLDGVCFTEHDYHWKDEDINTLRTEFNYPIFRGIEISCNEGDLIVFGLSEYTFGMHHAEVVRRAVDEVGGFIILAHPFRKRVRFGYSTSPSILLDEVSSHYVFDLVDAIEILNGGSRDNENEFAWELAKRKNLRGVGGSDAHDAADIPSFATEFERPVGSLEELIFELKTGRFRAVDLRSI